MRKGKRFGLTLGRLVIVLVSSFLSCLMSFGQDNQPRDGRYYESQARKAYEAKDYKAFLENMKTAAVMRPNHPRLMYNLAVAYALTGSQIEALQWLGRMTEMGLVFSAEKDSNFDSIRTSAEFKAILKSVERNRAPVINGGSAFTLHEKGFIPEGIAYDPVTETFFLGSVYKRKIVSINRKGEARDFATELDGLWSVMGMKVDAARRLLWVASAAHSQMSNYRAEENGTSGIFKFDLRTRKLIKKYLLPNQPKAHFLGDLVLSSHGDLWTSDSLSPAIYTIPQGKDELELFLENEAFVNLQGLAFTSDEKQLFLADYAKGIFLINLKTKGIVNLPPSPNMTLLGLDGLYSYHGSLIGVQNGINPSRLVRLFPSRDLKGIERLDVIEANDPVFDEPTLGVLVKDDFYLIANSQWGMIDPKGHLAPADKLKEPVVMKIKLPVKQK